MEIINKRKINVNNRFNQSKRLREKDNLAINIGAGINGLGGRNVCC